MLLVVVDQRAGSAEGLVVVAAGVGVLEVLDLAVHLDSPFDVCSYTHVHNTCQTLFYTFAENNYILLCLTDGLRACRAHAANERDQWLLMVDANHAPKVTAVCLLS